MKQVFIGAAVTALISVVASFLLVLAILLIIGGPLSSVTLTLAIFCPLVVAFPVGIYLFHQQLRLTETLEALKIAHEQLADAHAELADAHMRLSEKARHDDMTGLLNREAFLAALKVSRRRSDCGVLLIIDADHFKHINDTHGHGEGDVALLMIAKAIQTGIRAGDLVGRIGGEEFAAFLANTDEAEAMLVAERIRQAVEALRFSPGDGKPMQLSVSIGGTGFYPNLSVKQMMREADNSLYKAKATGRNRVVFGEPVRHLVA